MTMPKFLHRWRLNRLRDRVITCGERLRHARRHGANLEVLENLERQHQSALERFKEAHN
jgi:hypothetical protein